MTARDLTPEERRERGTSLCRRLAADVAKLAPEGIGRWDTAWEMVAGADATFMAALSGWEADPSEAALDRVRNAYGAVIDAWREAAHEYRARQEAG